MTVDRGTKLGPYEILEPLGAGGMGEVYKARDSRLNRTVAIKISAAQFGERFEREAHAIASLNHPNICALYDVGPDYLVMEFLEGPTLADRIAAGRIPLEEALAIARQIACALEAAHEKGIVHRDLKPANVKITPDGVVKVLDFGLAKTGGESASGDPNVSPTLTISPTRAGMILGTAAYMAPEQARGAAVDKRADIWAFGVVLYETLTGKQMFAGESVSDILAAVLRAETDWSALPSDTPPGVRRLLGRCLQRDRKQRLRDIGDARLDLDEAPTVAPTRRAPWLPWAIGALSLVALTAALWSRLHPVAAQPPHSVSRWMMLLDTLVSDVALSRDGTRLAYAGPSAGASALMFRMLDQPEAKPLPITSGGVGPVFSPDGQWIAFFDGQGLKKVPVNGGSPVSICDTTRQRGRTWGDDDTIVFGTVDGGLMRVPASGGTPQALTVPDRRKGETSHQWPHFLPGARGIVFTIGTGGSYDDARIGVFDFERGSYRTLVNGASDGRYVPTGHLVFARAGKLFAVPFDFKRLEITGVEVPVIDGLGLNALGLARYAFSDSGLLVYLGAGRPLVDRTVEWVDVKGNRQRSTLPPRLYTAVRLSPDGRRVAASIASSGPDFLAGGRADLWIGELERGTLTRLTSEGANFWPAWTPDGRSVTFGATRAGKQLICQRTADASGPLEVLFDGVTQVTPLSWTPGGEQLLYITRTSGRMQLSLLPVSARGVEGKPRMLLETSAGENHADARVSPDGHWIAYTSNESGRFEIFVRPFPGPGGKISISTQGGESPRWSGNGRELFYRDSLKNQVVAVDIQTVPEFRAGPPRPLFELRSTTANTQLPMNPNWDVTPDGKRFLVIIAPDEQETGVRLHAVVNWFEELRRLVPAGGQ